MSLKLYCLFPVPLGGVDVNYWRDLPAHQLRLLFSLVLHRPGNHGYAHPSISLPPPPKTFQGECVCDCRAKPYSILQPSTVLSCCFCFKRCPWSSPSPSQWFASSSWVCLCTRTPGTQGRAVLLHWPGSQFTTWQSTAFACPVDGDEYSVSPDLNLQTLVFFFYKKMHSTQESRWLSRSKNPLGLS